MNERHKTNPQDSNYPRDDMNRNQHKHQDEFEVNSNEQPLEKARSDREKHHYEDSQTDNERMIPDSKEKKTHKQDIIDRKSPNMKK